MHSLLLRAVSARPRAALAACTSGITTLEFAFITPVLLLLVMGVVELSLVMFTMSVMEGATSNTARMGKTGYIEPGLTREDSIRANLITRTGGLLNPDNISITYKVYSNFDKVEQAEPCLSPAVAPCPGVAGTNFVDVNGNATWDEDMGSAGLGDAGDVVVYTVTYPWPISTPIISAFMGSTYNITARTVVKNEPF